MIRPSMLKLLITALIATYTVLVSGCGENSELADTDSTSLTRITIPNGVSGIRNGAFSGCTNLTNVTIPDSVTSIGWIAFSGCANLTSVNISDTVTVISSGAFRGCTSLTSIAYKGKIYDYKNIAELYTPDAQM